MSNRAMHLFLKFNNEKLVVDEKESTTIIEHFNVLKSKGKLVWGQGSDRNIRGLGIDKRKKFNYQLESSIPTFVFFTAIVDGSRKLYVGNYINSYDRGTLNQMDEQVKYIPKYYSNTVGTINDKNLVFIETSQLIELDEQNLDNIKRYDNIEQKVMDIKNSSSLFYVSLNKEFELELQVKFMEQLKKMSINSNMKIIEEINFQAQVEAVNVSNDIDVKDEPKEKGKKKHKNNGNIYERDSKVAKKAIVLAKYCCEVDEEHKYFTSKVTNKNYVEAHHLIPIEYQDEFKYSIDVEANIISLCVACHKKLHHAVLIEKKEIIKKLYEQRKDRLKQCEIDIDLAHLYNYYK